MTKQKKRLGLSIPKALYQKLKGRAEYQGKTLNSICLEIFWDYFERRTGSNLPGAEGKGGEGGAG